MSTSSRTPDNKMHRHMQAISMLLGHRGKTPSMIKSRNKSPISVINVKTPRSEDMLKYQLFYKSLLKTYQMIKLKHKQDFLSRLKLQLQHYYPKYQISTPLQQSKRPHHQKYNRKIQSAQTIQEFINIFTNKLLLQTFQTLKQYVHEQTKNNSKANKTHRKTYSQMYTGTINNSKNKTPSTIYNYEYRTPEVRKEVIYESKSNEAKILFLLSEKILFKKISTAFSQIKLHSNRFLMFQFQQLQSNYGLNKQAIDQINRQFSISSRKNKLIEKQLQQSEQKLKHFTQQVNQLQNEVILAAKGQQNARKQIDSLRKIVQTTKRQLDIRSKQLDEVRKQLILQKGINQKSLKDTINLRRQVEITHKQCELIKKQVTKKQQQLSSIKEQFKLAKQKLQAKLKAIQKGPNPLDPLVRELQSQKKELQSEMITQKNLRKQLERKFVKVEKQLQAARNQIIQMEEKENSNSQIIKFGQEQLQRVIKQLETNRKQVETLRNQRQSLMENKLESINKQQLKHQEQEKKLESIKQQLLNKSKHIEMREKDLYLKEQQLKERQKNLSNQQQQLQLAINQFDLKLNSEPKHSIRKENQPDIESRDIELQSLKKQLLFSKQQYHQITNQFLLSQKLLNQEKEKTFLLSQKLQEKLIHHQQNKVQLLNLQRKIAVLIIYQILATKLNSRIYNFFQSFSQIEAIKSFNHSKCLFMEKVINGLLKERKKTFINHLFQTLVKQSSEKESEFMERSLVSQIKIKSLYSSKQSLNNASIISSNFDQFAKKVNKAFELKNTLHEIYSYCFQKIDYAALLYLSISNPLNKQIHKHMMDGFRKILFFSFSQTQQSLPLPLDNCQILKKGQQILSFLKKVDNKIVFTKIQAYSLLKLSADLRKNDKAPNQSIISQTQLKRELNDFLQQRNKMYQKTFQTWQRTKQMIEDYKMVSSQRSY